MHAQPTIPPLNLVWIKPRSLLILVSLAFLAGCAGQVNILPTLDESTTLDVDQGLVVARVINASSYPLPFNQLTIAPENLNESSTVKPERLIARHSHAKGTTVFASPVSSGSYALSSVRAFHMAGEYWYSRFASTDAKLGTFDVKPGKVTDLGTLIYYPKSLEDKYINLLLRAPEPETGEVLDKYFAFYDYKTDEVTGWKLDEREDERESLYISVVQNPVSYKPGYLAPDGTIYFLSKLGVIIKRASDGSWDLDAVDTNLELTSIAVSSSNDIVVGSSEGHLYIKKADEEWIDASLNSNHLISEIEFIDEQRVIIFASNKQEVTIYKSDLSADKISWEKLDSYRHHTNWASTPPLPEEQQARQKPKKPKQIKAISTNTIEGRKYLSIVTTMEGNTMVFSSSKTDKFEYTTDPWSVSPSDKKQAMSTIINAGAVELGIKFPGFWSWDGKTDYFMFDDETKDWKEISTFVRRCGKEITTQVRCEDGVPSKKRGFTFSTAPLFSTPNEAIAIANFSSYDAWSGKTNTETKILSTDDGGLNWVDTGNKLPKPYCSSLVSDVSDRALLSCNGGSGEFYESFDQGANWQLVREHENF